MRLLVLPSALFLTLALDACRDARQSATRGSARPTAEFIVAAGDSAYWVASDTAGLRVRGAPLELARVDGQFVEVYVVDDERSFGEADLVGQSVYKRDLRSGDSVRVFTDSIVPDIAYAGPGSGAGAAGYVLPLPPIPFAEPKWWRDVAPSLPVTSANGARDVWRHGAYSVVIRYDSSGAGRLALRDSVSREWAVMPLSAPATRIYWLDRPAFDAATRHALVRAFEEAAAYGTETHIAGASRVRLQLASMLR